jgi:hypothetical protein
MNSIIKSQPVPQEELDERKRLDKERLLNIKPSVDTSAPSCMSQGRDSGKSPSKKVFVKQGMYLYISSRIKLFILMYL